MNPTKKVILLSDIVIDAGTQPRIATDEMTIRDYAEAMETDLAKFPPLDVFQDDSRGYILADGFHRFNAAKKRGLKSFTCLVHAGNRQDALKFVFGANYAHGRPRTNDDKRYIVGIALKEFPNSADAEIARWCHVSQPFVGTIRKQNEPITVIGSDAPPPRRIGKDGKSRPVPIRQKPTVPLDKTGIEIPRETIELWNRWPEAQELVSYAEAIKTKVKAIRADDPLFRFVGINIVLAGIGSLISELELAIPYAVCPTCQGKLPVGCLQCKGGGYVNKLHWNVCVPEEIRKLRPKP